MSDEDSQEEQQRCLYFMFDSEEKMLQQPGVFVPVSVLAHSPLKQPHGSRQLISFLQSLPYPSVVVVLDSINQHNIMALKGVPAKSHMTPEKALRMALERGDLYMDAISKAMKESDTANTRKIALIRWEAVNDKIKKMQEAIVHKHYLRDEVFRKRADEVALDFINQRTPNSRYTSQRKTHAVKYVLDELPMCITGISYQGQRYQTLLYATSTISMAKLKANKGPTLWNLAYDVFTDSLFADLKHELVEADEGIEAQRGGPVLAIPLKVPGQTATCTY
ncbi:Cyclodipeptide synthase [Gracilaria domingensis]|nr:Cyclodipeptide synthase [Gracilaria domingensis]